MTAGQALGADRLRVLVLAEADRLTAAAQQPIPVRDGRIDVEQVRDRRVQLDAARRLRAIVDHPAVG